jgi:hypothetical protein
MITTALFLTALILAIIEQIISRGKNILAYAIIVIAIGLLITKGIL